MILNQIGRCLTERLEGDPSKSRKHKLLLMLDEFPALVRHHFLVTAAPPESELASRRAQAEARYQSFIETVGRQLAAGRQTKVPPATLEAAE